MRFNLLSTFQILSHLNVVAGISSSLFKVSDPPKINSPVWSLFTLNLDGLTTNANILTYGTAVSKKDPVWALSVYRNTLTHRNFNHYRWGCLQLLNKQHLNVIELLGKVKFWSLLFLSLLVFCSN